MTKSDNRTSRTLSPLIWIVILLVALGFADGLLFIAYRSSLSTEPLATQLVGYFGSGAFSVVTVSLVIPILIVFLNHYFDIGKAIQQRIQTQRQDLKKQLRASIEETSLMWDQTFALCGEVAQMDVYGESPKLNQAMQRYSAIYCKAEEVMTSWSVSFPNLSTEATDSFLLYLNVMFDCINSVAYVIRSCDKSTEGIRQAAALQQSLEIVRNGIGWLFYPQMLEILNRSASLLTLELPSESIDNARKEIADAVNRLRGSAEHLMTDIVEAGVAIPFGSRSATAHFRELAGNYIEWRRQAPDSSAPPDYAGFKKLVTAFNQVPDTDFVEAFRAGVPAEYVRLVARKFAFNVVLAEIGGSATWAATPDKRRPEAREAAGH